MGYLQMSEWQDTSATRRATHAFSILSVNAYNPKDYNIVRDFFSMGTRQSSRKKKKCLLEEEKNRKDEGGNPEKGLADIV